MSKSLRLLALLLLGLLSAAAPAPTPALEMPTKSEETLRRMATHVVVGDVRRVWTVKEKAGPHRYVRSIAEVAVTAVEAAAGDAPLAPGELVYVRWFERSWHGFGMPPAESNGHYGWAPERGDRVRAYLARNAHDGFDPKNSDGGFNAICPNGFEELERK
jgi:hypothetical protein